MKKDLPIGLSDKVLTMLQASRAPSASNQSPNEDSPSALNTAKGLAKKDLSGVAPVRRSFSGGGLAKTDDQKKEKSNYDETVEYRDAFDQTQQRLSQVLKSESAGGKDRQKLIVKKYSYEIATAMLHALANMHEDMNKMHADINRNVDKLHVDVQNLSRRVELLEQKKNVTNGAKE